MKPPTPPLRTQVAFARRLFVEPQVVLDRAWNDFGPVVQLFGGPMRMAIVGGAREIADVLSQPNDRYRWDHKFNVLGFVVGSESMIVSDGADHKRRRAPVQHAFGRRRLNGWIPLIVDRTDAAIDEIPTGEPVDLYRVGRTLILGIVVRALFGERLAARADEIGALFERPQAYLESPGYKQVPHPLPFTARARVRADGKALRAIVTDEMARIRAEGADEPDNVLASLVLESDLTDDEIRDQVVTLMGAGYDTTAASLAWLFWNAGLDPEVWAGLRAEADAIFDGPPDDETLRALRYADAVVHETLRLHPAGAISPRETAVDVQVGPFTIPAGTLLMWSPHLAGRDPSVFAAPLRFDPTRWTDAGPEQLRRAQESWVPFGGGRRNCIGFALAQMELVLIASRVAQRLDVVLGTDEKPRPTGMVVNRPAGGVPAVVARRDT